MNKQKASSIGNAAIVLAISLLSLSPHASGAGGTGGQKKECKEYNKYCEPKNTSRYQVSGKSHLDSGVPCGELKSHGTDCDNIPTDPAGE